MANVAGNQQVPPVNQNQNQNPAPVAQPPPEVWSENPNQGNFNPGTKEGAAIYKLKTKSDTENRLELRQASVQEFRRLLQAKEATFGGIVSGVPIEFDAQGNPTKHANMVSEYSTIDIKILQRNAIKRFRTALNAGDPIPDPPFQKRDLDPANSNADKETFYDRVNSQVVGTWIQNTLPAKSLQKS